MQRFCATVALIGGVVFGSSASADIVYSGAMALKVIDGDGGVGDPQTVTIADHSWEFGFVVGGPLDYAFINAQGEDAGLFSTGTVTFSNMARNFDANDTIGSLTTGLEMFPVGPGGSENENLVMHDYTDGSGEFAANGTSYIGFAFGGLGDRRYGWMQFSLSQNTERRIVTLLGWAYNDDAGGSILAGQTGAPAVPGVGAIAGLVGIAGVRGRRRRG